MFERPKGFKPQMIDEKEALIKQQADEAALNRAENAMQEVPEDNPFQMFNYPRNGQDVQMPIQSSMAETLLSDDNVPPEIREKYWYIFHKDNVLTFLDQDRKKQKLLNMDILKIDLLNSLPYYAYNFEQEYELGLLRNVFETKLDRALGTNQNVKNERTTLQSQFTEVKNINEVGQQDINQTGFFKKLLGRR